MLATTSFHQGTGQVETNTALIEAFISELHAEALSIAMVTSAAWSLQKLDVAIDVSVINSEAPDSGPLIDLLSCFDETDFFDTVVGLDQYVAALARAEACLAEFSRDVRTIGYRRAATVHGLSMAESWSAACEAADELVASSFHASPLTIHDTYDENVWVLRSLLRSAASGMRPCVDENQKLVKPQLPQQRRWPRKPVMEACQLSCGQVLSEICIVDISAGGAGLAHMPAVEIGQPVAIVLRSGRTLRGSVVWTHEGQAGIQFSRPLRANDSLLQV